MLWGTSYSGGHVVAVAAQDRRIAAAIVADAGDGRSRHTRAPRPHAGVGAAGARHRQRPARRRSRTASDAHRTRFRSSVRAAPAAILAIDGAEARYRAIAGPTWRNEVCARTALTVALNRPTIHARDVTSPLLVQIGEQDRAVPPSAERRAAAKAADAEVRAYPFDHFDVYDGEWQQRVLADQLDFLNRRLTPTTQETIR